MNRILLAFTLLVGLATLSVAQPAHYLQLNAAGSPPTILTGSTTGGVYTFPDGGGLLVTEGSLASTAWVLGGNSSPSSNIFGTLTGDDVIMQAGGLEKMRLINGGVFAASTTSDININGIFVGGMGAFQSTRVGNQPTSNVGSNITSVGFWANEANYDNNTAIGVNALRNTGGGVPSQFNTAIGEAAGQLDAGFGGNNNTFLGYSARPTGAVTNATAIGSNATVSQSNSLILGNGTNVGIGTSAPSYKLDIVGTGGPRFRVFSQDGFFAGMLAKNNTHEYFCGIQGDYESAGGVNSGFHIYDNTVGARRMVIDATGNMGIATDPTALLDVNGTVRIRTLSGAGTNIVTADGSGNLGSTTFAANAWVLGGNNAPASNIFGTTSATDVLMQTNNVTQLKLRSAGGIEIPVTTAAGVGAFFAPNGDLMMHSPGNANFFAGQRSGNLAVSGSFNTGTGVASLLSLTSGGNNTASGYQALRNTTDGIENAAIGFQTLGINTSGSRNAAVGALSLRNNTVGGWNSGIGQSALSGNTTGSFNTGAGANTLFTNSTSDANTGVGYQALYNTTGGNNTSVGANSLSTNTTGNLNTAIGSGADVSSGGLTNATAIGANASVSASNSLVLGSGANVGIGVSNPGTQLANATGNITDQGGDGLNGNSITWKGNAGGYLAGFENTDAASVNPHGILVKIAKTANSARALTVNSGGLDRLVVAGDGGVGISTSIPTALLDVNGTARIRTLSGAGTNIVTADGSGNLGSTTFAANAWVLGGNALAAANSIGSTTAFNVNLIAGTGGTTQMTLRNTGGIDIPASAASGVGVIYQAGGLFLHSFGVTNTFLGADAGNLTLTGNANAGVGRFALNANTTGFANAALGEASLASNTTGAGNTAIGQQALRGNIVGSSNSAVGRMALIGSTGSNNSALGTNAGLTNTTGSSNTFIGASADATSGTLSNATAIGAGASVAQSNALILGSGANVGIGTSTPGHKLEVMNGNIAITNNDNTAREARLYEPSGSGADYTSFKAQAQAAPVQYTLPVDGGTAGQVLSSSGGATPTLSWVTVAGGGPSFSLTSTAAANYNATNTDQFVQVTVTTGNKTVTLPLANTFAAGQSIIIKNLDPTATGNGVTIATSGGENIDDAAPGAFWANPALSYQAIHLYSDGVGGWYSW